MTPAEKALVDRVVGLIASEASSDTWRDALAYLAIDGQAIRKERLAAVPAKLKEEWVAMHLERQRTRREWAARRRAWLAQHGLIQEDLWPLLAESGALSE